MKSRWVSLKLPNRVQFLVANATDALSRGGRNLCRNIAIIDGSRTIEHDRISNVLRKLTVKTFVLNLREHVAEPPRLDGYEVRLIDETSLEVDVSRERPREKNLN